MAEFLQAWKIVDRNEGNYVNDPQDVGGETYRGIARNFHRAWEGWTIIDFYKTNWGEIPFNMRISTVYPPGKVIDDVMVPEFFEQLWNKSRAGEIKSQQVANIYFDFYVLHSRAVEAMQKALVSLGQRVTIDNIIGPQTLGAMNASDPAQLHDAFKAERKKMHDERRNSKFYRGWIARNDTFPNLTNKGLINASLGKPFLIVGLFGLGLFFALQSEHISNRIKAGDHD